jgi:hypothetical protein
MHERLWPLDSYSPYTPVGLVRMIQFRVNNDCENNGTVAETNGHRFNSDTICQPDDLKCHAFKKDPRCHKLFKIDETEAKTYIQKNSRNCALPPHCSEYQRNVTGIPAVNGDLASYGSHGFAIDFDYNITLNKQVLKRL